MPFDALLTRKAAMSKTALQTAAPVQTVSGKGRQC